MLLCLPGTETASGDKCPAGIAGLRTQHRVGGVPAIRKEIYHARDIKNGATVTALQATG